MNENIARTILEYYVNLDSIGLEHEEKRKNIQEAIIACGESVVPVLVEALCSDDEKAKNAKCDIAMILGQIGKPAVSDLKKILKMDCNETRFYAASALNFIGKDAEETIPILKKMLSDNEPRLRYAAIVTLSNIKPEMFEIIPKLADLLREDESSIVKTAAAYALCKIGKAAVPELVRSLESEDKSVRCLSAFTLGNMGCIADEAIAALSARLEETDNIVRLTAAKAIRSINNPLVRNITKK